MIALVALPGCQSLNFLNGYSLDAPHATDAFIIANLMAALVALSGYQSDSPLPALALWRVACTAIGVAVEAAVAALVLPVTAR